MNALAERFIEPSSSTDNSPFELIDESDEGDAHLARRRCQPGANA